MIRLGFVGLGWWGCELAAAAARLAPRFPITRCYAPESAEREAFAARFGAAPSASVASLLGAPDVDAVVIATPHSQHADQVEAAARAGRHVLVEKPFTLGVADGVRALDAARAAGIVIGVGHNRRLLAGPTLVRGMIEDGRFGTLLHVEANFSTAEGPGLPAGHWRSRRDESTGGPLAPLGIHVIDWLHWLLGPVASVNALTARAVSASGLDDVAAALLRFRSGVTGYLGTLYATPYTSELAVYGSAARATLSAPAPDAPNARPRLRVYPAHGPRETVEVPWVDTLAVQLARFGDAIDGCGTVAVSAEEGLRNVAVMAAILESAAHGGRPATPAYAAGY